MSVPLTMFRTCTLGKFYFLAMSHLSVISMTFVLAFFYLRGLFVTYITLDSILGSLFTAKMGGDRGWEFCAVLKRLFGVPTS